jgi:MFS family permease
MFAAGLGLFVAASAACALAGNVVWLIAARAVQGAGPALVMPLAMALLSAAFLPKGRGKALGAVLRKQMWTLITAKAPRGSCGAR